MWHHLGQLRQRIRPGTPVAWAGVVCALSLGLNTAFAQPPLDPVEDLQQALSIRPDDLANPTEPVIKFRHEVLERKIANLRTLGQLRRALALEEWKGIDLVERKMVGDRFMRALQLVIEKGDVPARMAAANLAAEIGPGILSLDPGDRNGFARSLTPKLIQLARDPSPAVRQEALRALGNTNPAPKQVLPVLVETLRTDKTGPRRQAAAALGQMVRVVAFLRKGARRGIEATRQDLIDVVQAAATGAADGVGDSDSQVRKLSYEAANEAARNAFDLVPEAFVRKEFPPEGRPLVKAEKEEIQSKQGIVLRDLSELEGAFKAFQNLGKSFSLGIGDPDHGVRTAAAQALEDVASARVKMQRRLMSAPALSKADEEQRTVAFRAVDPLTFFLRTDGEGSLAPIITLLKADDVTLRRKGVEILELLTASAAPGLPALGEALCDPDRYVRWAAARAIGNIGPIESIPYSLTNLGKLLSDTDNNVRLAAAATIEMMGAAARDIVPVLTKSTQMGDSEPRVASMYVLTSIGADNVTMAVPFLIQNLTAKDARVRRAAADVLGRLPTISESAIPDLRRALEDDDQETRINASEAILSIAGPRLP